MELSQIRTIGIFATIIAGTAIKVFPRNSYDICTFLAFLFWGLMISLQPPFYPAEATKKGATPSQVKWTLIITLVL